MATVPTKIVDKNGKQTTVHKNPEKTTASRSVPTVPVKQNDAIIDYVLNRPDQPSRRYAIDPEIIFNPKELTSIGKKGFGIWTPGYGVMSSGPVIFELQEIDETNDAHLDVMETYGVDHDGYIPEGAFIAIEHQLDGFNEYDFNYVEPFGGMTVQTDINSLIRYYSQPHGGDNYNDAVSALAETPGFEGFVVNVLPTDFWSGVEVNVPNADGDQESWIVMDSDEIKRNLIDGIEGDGNGKRAGKSDILRLSNETLAIGTGEDETKLDAIRATGDDARYMMQVRIDQAGGVPAFVDKVTANNPGLWFNEQDAQTIVSPGGRTLYIKRR
jgi:hypothetical protein